MEVLNYVGTFLKTVYWLSISILLWFFFQPTRQKCTASPCGRSMTFLTWLNITANDWNNNMGKLYIQAGWSDFITNLTRLAKFWANQFSVHFGLVKTDLKSPRFVPLAPNWLLWAQIWHPWLLLLEHDRFIIGESLDIFTKCQCWCNQIHE